MSTAHALPLSVPPYHSRRDRLLRSTFFALHSLILTFSLLSNTLRDSVGKVWDHALRAIEHLEAKRRVSSFCWFLLNNVLLLQMGTTYRRRFEDFAIISDDIASIDQWRKDQQDEWNRLSTTLALLATMNTTILAISPQAPNLAFAAWLGGAGLSTCGVFVVQYFSIKAFSVTDEDMGIVLQDDSDYASLAIVASLIAGPVVMKLWSAVLFLIGTVDYIVETEALSPAYKVLAILPVLSGAAIVLMAMVVGEVIDGKLYEKAGVSRDQKL
ncbi:hypothetical protein NMY22_g4655 [Coprinellus aureogranulatus]|nr:hypothetical protein NMY22_g4655 [Coprinellus aureogranulatus]